VELAFREFENGICGTGAWVDSQSKPKFSRFDIQESKVL
jgi:hypothetical protein